MKAMILAAGLGTRLRPFTLKHPKALVPVGGVPMLERVITRLIEEGFDDIVVNVHHFADQIKDFLNSKRLNATILVSDESNMLLDTGGALVKALPLLDSSDDSPFLVHNVDILSDAPLAGLVGHNMNTGADATLLVSDRDSSRRLVFDDDMILSGWHDIVSDRWRPEGFRPQADNKEFAFSGIYVARPSMIRDMISLGFEGKFGVMDYFLSPMRHNIVEGWCLENVGIIDIGKPATLSQANLSFLS
ncbi:MAG: NTP transferase domain-containing protein [Bacteroidales bacterium]|nr:NTP transferase domain-containing protein [Bacteroidales bacterium]